MRGLTIHQPFANFIADGTKEYETRSWRTSYTGPLAIHASKNRSEAEYSGLEIEGPFGAIVAVATLIGCIPSETQLQYAQDRWPPITEAERDVGDWSPGRYAWALADVVKLAQPVPARGFPWLWRLPPDAASLLGVSAE